MHRHIHTKTKQTKKKKHPEEGWRREHLTSARAWRGGMVCVKGFIPNSWSTCVLHSAVCYHSQSCTAGALNAAVVLWHSRRECDTFGWQEPHSPVWHNSGQDPHWVLCKPVSTHGRGWSMGFMLHCRMPWGSKGGGVAQQVKNNEAQVCHLLNELLEKLLCTCPSHSLD